jgi:hypothetical protein
MRINVIFSNATLTCVHSQNTSYPLFSLDFNKVKVGYSVFEDQKHIDL